MVVRHPGLCLGMSPVPVGSNPAGERLYLWTSMKWGRILFGLNPQRWTVFSGTDWPPESCFSILWDSQFPDHWFLQLVSEDQGDWRCCLQMSCKYLHKKLWLASLNLLMMPTRHWNISLPKTSRIHILEWLPGVNVCLPLIPKVLLNLG